MVNSASLANARRSVTVFGAAIEITLWELSVEAFFPGGRRHGENPAVRLFEFERQLTSIWRPRRPCPEERWSPKIGIAHAIGGLGKVVDFDGSSPVSSWSRSSTCLGDSRGCH